MIRFSRSSSRLYGPDNRLDQTLTRKPRRPLPSGLRATAAALAFSSLLAGCAGDSEDTTSADPDASATPVAPRLGRPIEVGGTPSAIAVGDGSVWVADNVGGTVSRIDAAGGEVEGERIRVGAGPEAIAVGEGAVWVASGDDTITRIDPAGGTAERVAVRVGDPRGIVAGEGSVWVASGSDGTVTRIDPETLEEVGEPIVVAAGQTIAEGGMALGDLAIADGAVWAISVDGATLTRIDAASGETGEPIAIGEFQALGLVAGEGALWVAATDDRLAQPIVVRRVDPSTSEVGASTEIPGAAIPIRLAAGEGAVWITLPGGLRPPDPEPLPSGVAYIESASGELGAAALEVGERPGAIAVGEGSVWVANSGDGTVSRIDPGP